MTLHSLTTSLNQPSKCHYPTDMKREEKLGLLNFEGDVIKMSKPKGDGIAIYDQWDNHIHTVDILGLCRWLDGTTPFVDAKGKEWFYTREHIDARRSLHAIFSFIHDDL